VVAAVPRSQSFRYPLDCSFDDVVWIWRWYRRRQGGVGCEDEEEDSEGLHVYCYEGWIQDKDGWLIGKAGAKIG